MVKTSPLPFVFDSDSQHCHYKSLDKSLVWGVFCQFDQQPIQLTHDIVLHRLTTGTFPSELADLGGWCWFHFDVTDSSFQDQIITLLPFSEEVQQELINFERNICLESEGRTIFGAFPSLNNTTLESEQNINLWRFALEPDLLLTTSSNTATTLEITYHKLLHGMVPRSPAALVDKILLEFASILRKDSTYLDNQLDRIEDMLLTPDQHTDLGHINSSLGIVRRRSTELRRILAPVNRIFSDEELDLPDWAEDDLHDHSQRQVYAAMDDLLALQERARSLQDELTSIQTEETNQRLYLVSIGTTLMLPATFVTGFFGMNTSGMFLTGSPWGTVEAGGVCFLFMVGTWLILKFSKLL
ncbi:MAG: magnesium transporter [Acetobacter sp.]|nr:magnesium transporter [Acetobacter sp.]MBQ5773600.1 magnesium transporter [Acetobacter sp.]